MMGWLEEKEPLPGESPEEADRRTRWTTRLNKWWFTWEVVFPVVLGCIVLVVLAVKSF